MFRLKHEIGVRLEINSLRVAMPIGPDLAPDFLLAEERIVRRYCPVVVQTKRLARE